MDALFQRDGAVFTPSLLTTGPWRSDAMHGGPPSALIGHVIGEQLEPHDHVARVTVELERPVPLVPLTVQSTRRQVSRRVAHIDVEVQAAGKLVLSGRGLVLQVDPLPEPGWVPSLSNVQVPGPEHKVTMPLFTADEVDITYHRNAVEHRMTAGSFEALGPANSWISLLHPVVSGEPVSGLCRVLAAADFGSGISAVFGMGGGGVGLINADLTVILQREPVGEWIGLESETRVDPSGSALAITTLADQDGELGVATQSLLSIRT